jgi:phytol kinase
MNAFAQISNHLNSLGLWLQVGAIALWLAFVFLLAELLRRVRGESELVRKVVHIGTGHVVLLAWWLHLPLWLCTSFSVIFSGIAYLSYHIPIFPMLNSVGRKTHGVFYYALSIACLVTYFWSIDLPQYAAIGVLVMTWGDGIAALVGQRWGKHSYEIVGNKKTLEGSFAMFVASYLVTLAILIMATPGFAIAQIIWFIPLPVAFVATGLEAVSPGGTDNLTVPLASAALCYGLDFLI